MAQRDYAARGGAKKKKKQKKNNKSLLFIIAAVVVAAFGLGLYLLKEKAPDPVVQPVETTEKNATEKRVAKSSGRSVELY